jgi:hypothetical protein
VRALIIVAAVAAALLVAGQALACPVCYGEADSPMIDGARMSVIFLGTVCYGLIGGAAVVVVALRRRVRAQLAQGATLPPDERN